MMILIIWKAHVNRIDLWDKHNIGDPLTHFCYYFYPSVLTWSPVTSYVGINWHPFHFTVGRGQALPSPICHFDSTMATSATPTIAPVSSKLPLFWTSDPHVWFIQAEAQFLLCSITTQKTMFEYIVAGLSPEVVVEVRNLLISPPTEDPYQKLKDALIQCTSASTQRLLQQLLNMEELGDRTPTQLLRRMRQLLGDNTTADSPLLRELFLQCLPPAWSLHPQPLVKL